MPDNTLALVDETAKYATLGAMQTEAPPYHITHLIPTAADGGVRRYVQQCCSIHSVRSSVIAIFATNEPADMALESEIEIRLDIPLSQYAEIGTIEEKVAAAVRQLKPDLLHSHHLGCDVYARPAAECTATGRMIRHVHGMLQRASEHPTREKEVRFDWTIAEMDYERAIEPLVSYTICVSRELRDKLSDYGLPREKLIVLSNGVDPAWFRPIDDAERRRARQMLGISKETYLIGFVGRIEPCKNADYLIELALRQQQAARRPQYLVVGSGPSEARIKRKVEAKGLSAMFTFHPSRLAVRDFYAALDVLILPSYTEGSPFVLLEAMACGIAVMAAAVGGILETIRDGVDGLLFDPNDIEAGLAGIAFLACPARRSVIGRRGRRRAVASFNIDWHQVQLLQLYDQVTGERHLG